MDIDKARDFIRQNHSAVLATYRADGRPQMSPVGAAIDDDGPGGHQQPGDGLQGQEPPP